MNAAEEFLVIRQWTCTTERTEAGRLVIIYPDGFRKELTAEEEAQIPLQEFRIREGVRARISEEGGHCEG